MKYTPEQKYSVIKKELSIHKEEVLKRNLIKKHFPITIEIEEGFYVIESKMNYEIYKKEL